MSFFHRAIRGDFSSRSEGPRLLDLSECLPGRSLPPPGSVTRDTRHLVTNHPLLPPYPDRMSAITFGMGCFWCSEGLFTRKKGVYVTAVGYAQGFTPNPTYEEVCSGKTNHVEVVRVVYDPSEIKFQELLKEFWEKHDPTSANRQGNDIGTQYRSGIYFETEQQKELALESKLVFQSALQAKQHQGVITTEIESLKTFYFAEDYHQQFDEKPGSRQYCGLRQTGATLSAEFVRG